MLTNLSVPPAWLAPLTLRRDLIEQGYNDRAIARLVRDGSLVKPRRGAYADGLECRNLDDRGRHALRSRAVLLQGQAPASLSHSSSLLWRDAPDYGLDLRTVQITRHDARSGRAEAGVRQHCGVLPEAHRDVVHGIPVTGVARSALEFTTIAGVEAGVVQVCHLLHTGQTSEAQLAEMAEFFVAWPHTLATDIVLRLADARIESVAEARFFTLCFRRSVPMPTPQYSVTDAWGNEFARLDFAWPERKRWVELDGKVKYEKLLRPGERASDVVLREKRREKIVSDITGWECMRLDNDDLSWGQHTADMVKRFLGEG